MKRKIQDALKLVLAKLFHAGQRIGISVLPKHFYSEIPDIRALRKTQHWREPFSMIGVNGIGLDGQLDFLHSVMVPDALETIRTQNIHQNASSRNGEGGFGTNEADVLYAFVHSHRPNRIVQVGCGLSTAVCLAAASDAGYEPVITCVEPFPNAFLKEAASQGEILLIEEPVQVLDHSFVSDLAAGDFFFVDSTHTLGPSGEVTRLVLEVLPRLQDGVIAHFHDIWFPYDYRAGILESELFFWHESALLHAYLVHNSSAEILASLSMLHYGAPSKLAGLLPNYNPRKDIHGLELEPGHYPTSIYLRLSNRYLND